MNHYKVTYTPPDGSWGLVEVHVKAANARAATDEADNVIESFGGNRPNPTSVNPVEEGGDQ